MSDAKPPISIMEARWKSQLAATIAKAEFRIFVGVSDHGEPREWVAMLRRVADVLEAYAKETE